ncbi:MAG: hypothetical protein A3G37_00790 [Omnitrophica WOR_2 bacterium RIFCSPLOWO2_12_FULL_46_30]|nr:MAG: hypothetical protein A3D27_00720 [Omnitrophica WOR_2 bacterium RIFCSPHIGHO2_02_FULL_46_37]OGX42253.1 MAG: hypothetical protein A3H41_04725 [Omnitrophica WOR_2 bacterium RIFCSPLOWO2_02_FULL_45_28]OGX50780.1 MAG: hypothetical protein A3G37_00790 [Omnitrophica WOR_2 bacterium RIFCSPLOWO2_12_FULL_46_30]
MDVDSKTDLGTVKIHQKVIASIATIAALEIEGVKEIARVADFDICKFLGLKNSKSIKVEFSKNGQINLEIPLVVRYGYNIPEISESVQESVRGALEKMVDKSPRYITINIQGIEKV